jgi:Ca-activated chloride channel homolog
VVTLDVRPNPENPNQRAIYTGVQNFSSNAMECQLDLRFGSQILDTRALKLGPLENAPQVFIASQEKNGVFSVNLAVKDDLAADNQASVLSILPEPVKVLLVTRGNRFLEKALRAAGGVELSVTTDLREESKGYDVVVLDDVLPATWPKGNVLAIHVAGTNWFEGMRSVEAPAIVDWKNTHPLLRYVNFDNVQIAETMAVKAPGWAVPLVDGQATPLVLAGELNRQRIIWIGFDTLQSSWPLRISFPIFMANAVEWLNPASGKANRFLTRAGEPLRWTPPDGTKLVEVTLPDGSKRQVEADPKARDFIFGDTGRQGTYRLKAGTTEALFCVNLLDAPESSTQPRAELKLGKHTEVAATSAQQANAELWRWLALAGLAVLMFEWWYYHRRTV